jgi:hypothetical protein
MKRNYDDEALYLRMRLLRLHGFNRILYGKKTWKRIEECLIEKTASQNVKDVGRVVLPQTFTEEASREAEFALVEINGAEIYSDAALLKNHVEGALLRWRVRLMMDAIYASCGHKGPSIGVYESLWECALDAAKKNPEDIR